MKKATTLFFGLLLFNSIKAQTPAGDNLDINNIKARFNADGSLFNSFGTGFNQGFEVPKGSGTHTFFSSGLWIGGYDNGGVLKLAGQTYSQTGHDFFPGPLNTLAATDSLTMIAYNKVWKINKCTIDSFIVNCQTGLPGYVTPSVITNWPAFSSFGQHLAPFFDANNDGLYNADSCDYPIIKGDQAVFFVFNDKGKPHTETGGAPIGVEIQAMAYAYNCSNDAALYNTVFTNYKVINKSSFRLDSTFIGNWADFDIGAYNDDYVGCDVTRSAMYVYNGDLIDGPALGTQAVYGANPPAQATVFLRGPLADADGTDTVMHTTPNGFGYGDLIIDNERLGLSNFVYYNNDANPVNGNPAGADDFYQFLNSTWRNGFPVTYGGAGTVTTNPAASYMFPGNSDPLGFGTGTVQAPWDETVNTPSDRRGVGSVGPFTLQAGATQEIDFAYVYARATTGGNLASVTAMQNRIDSVKQKFTAGITPCGCGSPNGINNLALNNTFSFYPNPASSELTVNYNGVAKSYSIKVYNALGQLVKSVETITTDKSTVNISDLNTGVYLLNVFDGENSTTKRFVKQ